MLRMVNLPSGVSARNGSSSTWSPLSLLWMYSPIFFCPWLPSQRGPMATISLVYCQAFAGSMRNDGPIVPGAARAAPGAEAGEPLAGGWLTCDPTSFAFLDDSHPKTASRTSGSHLTVRKPRALETPQNSVQRKLRITLTLPAMIRDMA